MGKMLTQKEVAVVCKVSPRTIRRWLRDGKFPAGERLPNGECRWTEEQIADWQKSLPRDCPGGSFGDKCTE